MVVTEAGSSTRPRVSLTMIVRDEERDLPGCLDSVADLVDEVVIADTGSVDRTREVSARYGARVVDFPWRDHFAEARNAALRHATGDWIFWLDADDRLDAENRARLRDLFAGLGDEHAAFVMRQANSVESAPGTSLVFDRVHLWKAHPEVRWERRVHEQVLPSLGRVGASIRRSGVTIRHLGYHDAATHSRKAERNLRLLEMEAAESPADGFTLFNLACSLHALGRAAEAVEVLARCAAIAPPGISYRRKLHALRARSLHGLSRREEALAACRAGRREFPDDEELTFLEALMLRERGELGGSEALLRRLLAASDEATMAACADPDLRPIKARNQLAEICASTGRDAEAEDHWRAIARERPGYVPCWSGLATLYGRHGHREAALEALERLHTLPPHGPELAARIRSQLNAAGSAPAKADLPGGPGPAPTEPDRAALPPGERLRAAELAFKEGRLDEAGASYRDLLAEGHLPGLMLCRLGMIADRRGDFARAWELHRRAIDIDPRLSARITPDSYRHHGVCCRPSYELEEVPTCPACGSVGQEPIRVVNGLLMNCYHEAIDPIRRWVACLACGHGFANPRPAPRALRAAYAEPPPDHLTRVDYASFLRASDLVRELWDRRPGGRFLDIGAAQGILAGVAREFGYEATAVDLNPSHGPSCRAFGVEFLLGEITDMDLGDRRFDVIAAGDVIEHVAHPRRLAEAISRHLAPGGIAWISTPNREGAWSRRLGHNDPMWLETEHLHFFTRRSLARLLSEAGLAATSYRLSPRYVGGSESIVERALGTS